MLITTTDRLKARQATQMLRRVCALLSVVLLGLSLVLAAVPDVEAAVPDHHIHEMQPCAECPQTHHDASDGAMPDCHHVISVALATLPPVTGLTAQSFDRADHGLPSAETGSHRMPEHDLPPPRA